ncbi:hypothetical protein DPMN_079358 [Dreissena polymorpha]|uniref:Uncharacterized protein n=1 Tax=Dreissena polymorpha TaxID=45954 RepID=A0A9D3YNX1_DREPO|nr:hypothetical protein DPMN_079358 [Dreissena polymorpha]
MTRYVHALRPVFSEQGSCTNSAPCQILVARGAGASEDGVPVWRCAPALAATGNHLYARVRLGQPRTTLHRGDTFSGEWVQKLGRWKVLALPWALGCFITSLLLGRYYFR